jgi:hypothetical protein
MPFVSYTVMRMTWFRLVFVFRYKAPLLYSNFDWNKMMGLILACKTRIQQFRRWRSLTSPRLTRWLALREEYRIRLDFYNLALSNKRFVDDSDLMMRPLIISWRLLCHNWSSQRETRPCWFWSKGRYTTLGWAYVNNKTRAPNTPIDKVYTPYARF